MQSKKIAIIYPHFMSGGGESVTAWAIESLKKSGEISLFTCDNININSLNKNYGTNLSDCDVKIINPPVSFLLEIIPGCGLLKYHFLIRFFRKHKDDFDLVMGTYKEADFGKKGVQYIHFPELKHDLKNLGFFAKIYYKYEFLRDFYKNLCYFISGFNQEEMKKNITITNSVWTKKMIKKNMGIDSTVIYPPVLDDFPFIPWSEKKDGFVCISRISPEKRIKLIIEIVKSVRSYGYDFPLHIIGSVGDLNYFREIKKIKEQKDWIFIHEFMPRNKFISMVASYKYGIHGRKDEHFGISVAEMAKAGCIVFVPNDGGQTEIVTDNNLIYSKKEDAVFKICQILENKKKQIETQSRLLTFFSRFSMGNFKSKIIELTQI